MCGRARLRWACSLLQADRRRRKTTLWAAGAGRFYAGLRSDLGLVFSSDSRSKTKERNDWSDKRKKEREEKEGGRGEKKRERDRESSRGESGRSYFFRRGIGRERIKNVVFAVIVPGLKEHSCCIASLLFWLACGRRSCSPPRVADLTVGTCAVNTAQDCGA